VPSRGFNNTLAALFSNPDIGYIVEKQFTVAGQMVPIMHKMVIPQLWVMDIQNVMEE